MHIHVLGICGTFMAGVALLARELGHEVTGQDANVYPPMSTQLESQGIQVTEGYSSEVFARRPDLVVIGNAMSRGNEAVEFILNNGLPYLSGPQWLYEYVLKDRWVVAVAGTHGKTTTSSMLAWIAHYANLQPGFLIGGVPENFGVSARLGNHPFFVIEADEYDSAFFDKRSKFIHYHPRTLVLNNLEFDHVDIFPDLAAIQKQFHYLIRTVPGTGLIIMPRDDENLQEVVEQGCWTPIQTFALNESSPQSLTATLTKDDGSEFTVKENNQAIADVHWPLLGTHNVNNGLAAILAARHIGVPPAIGAQALHHFKNVKRRMEIRGCIHGVTVYDDFAHHPTAIATTLEGLRANVQDARIIAIVDFDSHTMKKGVHKDKIQEALQLADQIILAKPGDIDWGIETVAQAIGDRAVVFDNVPAIVAFLKHQIKPGDHIVVMSNKGFEGIHEKLLSMLAIKEGETA